MSKSFYHPEVGYWQTTTDTPDASAYPIGTVEVPIKPGPNMDWDAATGQWVAVAPLQVSQFEKDQLRYQRRAAAKDGLIAWMAAGNMARVRAGVWTVADLQVLLVELGAVNAMMQTLSFELAAQAIAASTNPLLTPEIKAAWVGKLTEHFYIVA